MRVELAKNFCNKNSERGECKGIFQVSFLLHSFSVPFPRRGDLERKKNPKVIWFQLLAVKIEFVARN